MSNMEQVVENVAFAVHSQPHNLTPDELALVERVRDTYRSMGPIDCTGCRYCMPCLTEWIFPASSGGTTKP